MSCLAIVSNELQLYNALTAIFPGENILAYKYRFIALGYTLFSFIFYSYIPKCQERYEHKVPHHWEVDGIWYMDTKISVMLWVSGVILQNRSNPLFFPLSFSFSFYLSTAIFISKIISIFVLNYSIFVLNYSIYTGCVPLYGYMVFPSKAKLHTPKRW